MNLAWLSVGALIVAVTVSCTTTINVGILAMAMALVVGVFVGGMTPSAVLEGFPSDLLVTLVGVTLLFAIAEVNGTLERLTARAVRLCRGFAVSTIGAGATPASALLAPPAMAVAARAGVPPLLMAVMAGNGALAGTLSPFAPTGIVAHGVMARIGLGGVVAETFVYNALAHALVGIGGFVLLGGWRLFRRGAARAAVDDAVPPFERAHWLTAAGIGALIVGVAGFGLDTGMMALIIATSLILLRTVEEGRAIQRMPWGVMLMVTGVTVLIALMQSTQGVDLITNGIASLSTPSTIAPVVAFGSGIVSVYSSTSGVVLPAFLPMAPDLAQRLGGLDPVRIAWSINVGASLVDLSSLSTVGALFIAGSPPGTDTKALFNGLLVWGLSMAVVGAAVCWIAFG
jgi:di/tricarboxylate transporter